MRYIQHMSKDTSDVPFSMRIEPQLKADLQELADRDKRSLTNLVKKILSDYVAAHKPRSTTAKT
jgi:predicted HicB family RNase H-like nuclease